MSQLPTAMAGAAIPDSKTGTSVTAAAHFFCAMVGSGVLAFPSAMSWLGWIAGPILIFVFYAASLLTAHLLAAAYETNDGVQHGRYHHAVNHILGKRSALACSIFQMLTLFLVCIAWTITGATSCKAIADEFCTAGEKCFDEIWAMALLFGAVSLVLSQVRNLEEAWWMSVIGVLMSFIYSIIAFIASAVDAGENGAQGTIGGKSADSLGKAMGVLNALGIVALGFSGGQVLLEIEDTLRQPPKAEKSMNKASTIAITGAVVFYAAVAFAGYAAYGNEVDGFIFNSISGPSWAVVLGNIAILIHVLTAFQVFAQAVFETLESHAKWWLLKRKEKKELLRGGSPVEVEEKDSEAAAAAEEEEENIGGARSGVSNGISPASRPLLLDCQVSGKCALDERYSSQFTVRHSAVASQNSTYALSTGLANAEVPRNADHVLAPLWVRLVLRSAYVLLVTMVAAIMPFFSAISGFVGSIIFWPLIVHFPIVMYRKMYAPLNRTFDIVLSIVYWGFLVVCAAATVASVYSIIQEWKTFQFFQ